MVKIPDSQFARTTEVAPASENQSPPSQARESTPSTPVDFPQINIDPQSTQTLRRKSGAGRRRKSNRSVLVASLASFAVLSVVVGMIVFAVTPASNVVTNDEAMKPPSSLIAKPERMQPGKAMQKSDRLGPARADRQQLDRLALEDRQPQLSRRQVPADQDLRGETVAASQSFWSSCVDPAHQRLTLEPGVHLLEEVIDVAPSSGLDNFLVTSGVVTKPGTPMQQVVSILSCPTLEIVQSLPGEMQFVHKACDVAPSGNYILEGATVGTPGNRHQVLRLHSFPNGTAKDIPFHHHLLATQLFTDDLALLQTKDGVLQLFDLQQATGKRIHKFSGAQLTYWKVTPGKRFVLVFSGGSPASLRVFEIDQGMVRDHAHKSLAMEREFVVRYAEISPNGRFLHLGFYNPRASRKRLRIIDLETGETIQDVEDSELPDSLTFSVEPPVLTDDASWLFPTGQLVNCRTLAVTWRAEEVFSDFRSYDHKWIICANNFATTFQPLSRARTLQVLVAELPKAPER